MAVNNYLLHITSKNSDAKFIVGYRAGKFYRIEKKSGKLNQKQRNSLMMIVPDSEADIDNINQQYVNSVSYSPIVKEKSDTLYSKFMSTYFDFYERNTEVKPVINAVQGKALKSIITHLKTICTDDAECLATWEVILSNWNKLDNFYGSQMDLKQINSNLNTIIRQIKHGKSFSQTRKQANNYADELRQSI